MRGQAWKDGVPPVWMSIELCRSRDDWPTQQLVPATCWPYLVALGPGQRTIQRQQLSTCTWKYILKRSTRMYNILTTTCKMFFCCASPLGCVAFKDPQTVWNLQNCINNFQKGWTRVEGVKPLRQWWPLSVWIGKRMRGLLVARGEV